MDANEKPLQQRFWTWDMIALLAVNIVFIVMIIVGLWLVLGALHGPFMAWLENLMHI